MSHINVVDYAERLLDAHGAKAEAEAARRAAEAADEAESENWHQVRETIRRLRAERGHFNG